MKDADADWLDEAVSRDDLPSAPPEVKERVIRQVHERLAAERAPRAPQPAAVAPADEARRDPPAAPSWPSEAVPRRPQGGPTLRSPVIANDVAAPLPAVVPAPAFLKSTEPALDLPAAAWAARAALPFAPAPPRPPARRAVKTAQSRVLGLEPGKTEPLGEAIAQAVAAVLPFRAAVPPLTSRRYASLCAELDLWPARTGEILRRYQILGDAARVALDAYWAREHAARPEARAAFEGDFAYYTAWLRAQWA